MFAFELEPKSHIHTDDRPTDCTCLPPMVLISMSGEEPSSTLPHESDIGISLSQRRREPRWPNSQTQKDILGKRLVRGLSELILDAAESMCTRKAHSRTANMRCLFNHTANNPLRKTERKVHVLRTCSSRA